MFNEGGRGELLYILKAFYAWIICALISLLMFSYIITKSSLDSSYIAYISSFISFITAMFAGIAAAKYRKGSSLYTGIFTGLVIVILLLTLGFAIDGNRIESSGIISVVTFTFSGILLGSNLVPLFLGKKNKNLHIKRRS